MTADFANYFRSLVAALGERPGWYGLYAARDPEAGRGIPPWDVVRTVLRDLAVNAGVEDVDPAEAGRAYALYRAALAAEDAEPGAEVRLSSRLAAAEEARESAMTRAREAARAYAHHSTPARAQALSWTRDDLTRATTRCKELHDRLTTLPGARPVPPSGTATPVPEPGGPVAPRGARFAGAPQQAAEPARAVVDPRWVAEARQEAARLGRLRQTGESGAAYLVLCAAAEGPAERIPYVVRELERTGLAADVATLLWEIAALPPQAVAEAVAALAADGRAEDSRTLLHQVAARAAGDVALVADLLHGAGLGAEAGELLETVARARTADAAAAVARARPALTAALLAAAARVSPPCHRDLAAALTRP
ncbi:hypothetical protein [Actinacidiphila cocklensis]|uniref:UL36 very large tegument protein n=1 Tax=Actinacidiphila cocklensis TaxID=887465 RepID=A0A9W4DR76_9ACTN|nr:hypothetical protein [Actinacidiphila cocklensis]CAG6396177.1 conserved hypothetical protein [Actinacidiphila cocklensis]